MRYPEYSLVQEASGHLTLAGIISCRLLDVVAQTTQGTLPWSRDTPSGLREVNGAPVAYSVPKSLAWVIMTSIWNPLVNLSREKDSKLKDYYYRGLKFTFMNFVKFRWIVKISLTKFSSPLFDWEKRGWLNWSYTYSTLCYRCVFSDFVFRSADWQLLQWTL